MERRIGILGRGRLGSVLAARYAAAGIAVETVGSDDPAGLARVVACDLVILAIPLSRLRTVPAGALDGALVVDATNHWWEVDGSDPALQDPRTSTSETVQAWFAGAHVVKSLGHASVWELENLGRPAGAVDRRAIAVAGDRAEDVESVAALVEALGFDAVPIGPLAAGVMVEPGSEAFGADATAAELRAMIARFPRSQRGRVLARARGFDPATWSGPR